MGVAVQLEELPDRFQQPTVVSPYLSIRRDTAGPTVVWDDPFYKTWLGLCTVLKASRANHIRTEAPPMRVSAACVAEPAKGSISIRNTDLRVRRDASVAPDCVLFGRRRNFQSFVGSRAVVCSSWWRYPGCRSSAAVLCTLESVATAWGRVAALDPAVTRDNIGRIHSPILPFMPRPQTLPFCTECRARIWRVLAIRVLLFAASEDVQPFDADRINVCLGF
jgi:hypothetical protein